ncbi:MAG TPA: alpha/beta hydrolase domain-containing protein [Vicinamibacterales bacterium]|nr:alpha/beta hydrolase domain-containing protein [Vicinamibacterales bacterium]
MKTACRTIGRCILGLLIAAPLAEARVVRLKIERREAVLSGKAFGLAGPYEKLVGKVEFALDARDPHNEIVVDLPLAPRNSRGEVEFSADFYLLKPTNPAKGNGALFYEVGNRGGKSLLATFQKASGSNDPTKEAEFGDGALMRQGYALLWMGWQWDVPNGRMRMDMPIASENGKPITGLVRGNFILNQRAQTALLADRDHQAYPVLDFTSQENTMTVRDNRLDSPQLVSASRWRFVDKQNVSLEGGFEPGRIYDVIYRAKDPRVVGVGLAGTRDLISFIKHEKSDANPIPDVTRAIAWGVSQSGRFLRHFLYQGFNEDEQGRQVFDGVIDQVGGSGRGSFNHRFGQASRDALEHFNILFPVDMFPFADGPERDPETGVTDALLARAEKSGTTPKLFHVLTESEYFNRAGSLVTTNPEGTEDTELPPTTRVYMVSSAPHGPGPFPPVSRKSGDLEGLAALNPLDYRPVIRALFAAMDRWVSEGAAPPPSRYPHISDGTLVARESGGWPAIPGFSFPPPQLIAYRLDFGSRWPSGIIDHEPPVVGKPYVVRVPSVDSDGNDRAGIRLPDIAVPLATHAGWNFRAPAVGAPQHLAGEIGSYIPFARTRAERDKAGDPRPSIEERYSSRDQYVGKAAQVALELVRQRYMLAQDVPDVIRHAEEHWEWAVSGGNR